MSTLYEHNQVLDTLHRTVYSNYWAAQTFTPSVDHFVEKVVLFLRKAVGSPGTLTVSIKETDAGKPTGNDLCVGIVSANNISPDAPGEWVEIVFTTQALLSSGTMYAIVVRCLDGDSNNWLRWTGTTTNAYASGTGLDSPSSGSSWTINSAYDLGFEEWGSAEKKIFSHVGELQAIWGF